MGTLKNNSSSSSFHPSLRPSFREALRRAKEQLEYPECYTKVEQSMYWELICIIAEVYLLSPDRPIRVSGEWIDGYAVQEVFGQLDKEHLVMVNSEFEKLTADIKNKKAYLRTMLYNSVFTLDAHYTNLYTRDVKGDE